MGGSTPINSSYCFSKLFGKPSLTRLNFTLQWIARQSREEKIVYRIRNIHLKVLLYGLAGIKIIKSAIRL
jgi:hypothetical protein